MIFVIGGYAQGQKEYASDRFGEDKILCEDVNSLITGENLSPDEAMQRLLELVGDADDAVVIGTQVGNGIVPIKQSDREERDHIGQLQIMIAEKSDMVIRVICGLGQRIK